MKPFFWVFVFFLLFSLAASSLKNTTSQKKHDPRGLSFGDEEDDEYYSDDDGEFAKFDDLDPDFPNSWHLHSISDDPDPYAQLDVHVNVEGVWRRGISGKGIRIGIGFLAPNPDHDDLKTHQNPKGNIKYPSDLATAVIGTALGTAYNNVCTRGVAHGASFTVSGDEDDAFNLTYLGMKNPEIFLQPFTSDHAEFERLPCFGCWENVRSAVNRGIVVVSFPGNGGRRDNCNYDMYINHPFSINVGSYMLGGFPSDFTVPCATTLVSAPGGSTLKGIVVPDAYDDECSERGGGQFSSAIVAGVVALMLEASTRTLTPRDIAHILVETARFPKGMPFRQELDRNGAGRLFDEKLGFGMVDAYAAVQMASGKTNPPYFLAPEEDVVVRMTSTKAIPDMGMITVPFNPQIFGDKPFLVDWVTLEVNINHEDISNLDISLTSPLGTRSQLATSSSHFSNQPDITFYVPDEPNHITRATSLTKSGDNWRGGDMHIISSTKPGDCCTVNTCTYTTRSKPDGAEGVLLLIAKNQLCTPHEEVLEVLTPRGKRLIPDVIFFEEHVAFEPELQHTPAFSVSTGDLKLLLWELIGDTITVEVAQRRKRIPDLTFESWKFSTTKNWGEKAKGTWILEISDVIPGNYGDLRSAILTLHSFIPLTPPAPAPSPHPTPAPHPTPTPTRGKSNCCVYSYFADHDIKQCLTLGSTCHDLPNFVLTNTQYDVYDDECYLYCAPPVPTPTVFVPKAPTPTPVPSPAPTNCCVYKFVHDTKIQQCLPLQSACIDLFNWQLDYVMFNNDCTFCYSPGG